MPGQIEDGMTVDLGLDELEYGLKAPKTREQRLMQVYTEMEEQKADGQF